jgi:hypothetical protein
MNNVSSAISPSLDMWHRPYPPRAQAGNELRGATTGRRDRRVRREVPAAPARQVVGQQSDQAIGPSRPLSADVPRDVFKLVMLSRP